MDNSEILQIKKRAIDGAISLAKDCNLELDFTDESIDNVELILSALHENYIIAKDDYGLNGLAFMLGLYIVDVIEKNHGKGNLQINHKDFGQNSFPFSWNESTLFPTAWCQKRIFEGKENDVVFKYKTFILEKNKNAQSTDVD
ncbi:hypothetical protein [Winogradskyella jejuensis]|uniref:Uncharacterized protein n=1 Tax=Winogradskyella jejuensis TaxID=1089305 RepID=A0A1M5NI34_9FLAO|nr:hypothetical protein [Winogradskyella jejuensis]SHG89127.1 hypothetical protein SAMN05444148_1211 [Winogradskyella jejuensis]